MIKFGLEELTNELLDGLPKQHIKSVERHSACLCSTGFLDNHHEINVIRVNYMTDRCFYIAYYNQHLIIIKDETFPTPITGFDNSKVIRLSLINPDSLRLALDFIQKILEIH